jgi:hypothetical protein
MTLTRRRAIQITSVSALISAVAPAAFAFPKSTEDDARFEDKNLSLLNGMTSATFKPYIGTTFSVTAPVVAGKKLVLLSVVDFPATSSSSISEKLSVKANSNPVSGVPVKGFYLSFQGPSVRMPQNTYTLQHPSLGTLTILLVPSSTKSATAIYTATFAFLPAA